MIRCFTTMDKKYYQGIGKVMIYTWLENFSKDSKLHLYLEDFSIDIDDDRIVLEPWEDVSDLFNIWRETRFSGNARHQKFTLKALAQISFWKKYPGKSLWLDADIISLEEIPLEFFDKALEDYPLASWGEGQFESGTVFVNTEHRDFKKILQVYESIYVGTVGLPNQQRWFDGELLGWACVEAGSKHKNLWIHCDKKTSTPLNYSWFGQYIRHLKAKQKNHLKNTLLNELERTDLIRLLESET